MTFRRAMLSRLPIAEDALLERLQVGLSALLEDLKDSHERLRVQQDDYFHKTQRAATMREETNEVCQYHVYHAVLSDSSKNEQLLEGSDYYNARVRGHLVAEFYRFELSWVSSRVSSYAFPQSNGPESLVDSDLESSGPPTPEPVSDREIDYPGGLASHREVDYSEGLSSQYLHDTIFLRSGSLPDSDHESSGPPSPEPVPNREIGCSEGSTTQSQGLHGTILSTVEGCACCTICLTSLLQDTQRPAVHLSCEIGRAHV